MIKKAFVLVATLVLAGCASIPTQLDVQSGPDIAPEAQQEFAYYTPSGPSLNATSQEIVSGFLAAGTSPLNDYAVAREFLSDDFAQRWNPENQTVIRAGAPVFRQAGESLVVVELSAGARIDDQGRYEDSVELSTTNLRFGVALQDGQWRISSAPNLTVVTPPVFSVVFNAFPVYFLDSSMVPSSLASLWFWGSVGFYNASLPEIAPREEHDGLSAKGYALGYWSSLIILVICAGMIIGVGTHTTTFCFVLVGLWWLPYLFAPFYLSAGWSLFCAPAWLAKAT